MTLIGFVCLKTGYCTQCDSIVRDTRSTVLTVTFKAQCIWGMSSLGYFNWVGIFHVSSKKTTLEFVWLRLVKLHINVHCTYEYLLFLQTFIFHVSSSSVWRTYSIYMHQYYSNQSERIINASISIQYKTSLHKSLRLSSAWPPCVL